MWWQRSNKDKVQADTTPKQVEKLQHLLPFHWYTDPLPFSWYRLKPVQYTSEQMSLEEDAIKRALQIPSCEWHEATMPSYQASKAYESRNAPVPYYVQRYHKDDRFAIHQTPSGKLLEVSLMHVDREEGDKNYTEYHYAMTVDMLHKICCTKITWYESSGRREQYRGYSGVIALYLHASIEIDKAKAAHRQQQEEKNRIEKQRQDDEAKNRREDALKNW